MYIIQRGTLYNNDISNKIFDIRILWSSFICEKIVHVNQIDIHVYIAYTDAYPMPLNVNKPVSCFTEARAGLYNNASI